MNEINIRQIAEKVWSAMSEGEQITLTELSVRLNLGIEITALAIGWLASEDKVCIRGFEKNIELSPKNRHPFYFG